MALNSGKYTVEEFDGVRCAVVEKGVTPERAEFLRDLLEFNGLEVRMKEDKTGAPMIGVTSVIFNPVIAVYERRLRIKDGRLVTADYYNQKTTATQPNYWDKSKKDFLNV